jgi:hypothetical protein
VEDLATAIKEVREMPPDKKGDMVALYGEWDARCVA